MASLFDIPLDGPSFTIWKSCELFLNDILQSKFGCVAIVSGTASEGYRSVMPIKKPAPVSEKRFEALVSGVKVSVHKADLSNFPVDAVVNAANEGLQHVGGIALALSKAGGPQIQEDSDEHVRKFGVLKTGEAIALPARLLPCKVIIHAVGPKISRHSPPNFRQAEQLLDSAVLNSLRRAEECHLKSVALPAISSGLFGYPLPQCADSIVRSVRWFCEKSQVKYLKEILLVNIDDRTVTEMEKACKRIFSTHSASSSAGNKTAKTYHSSTHTVQLGTVQLTLKQGQIEEQQTDVIVNTAVKDCWNSGQISRAILKKAGPKMEEELKSTRAANGSIITTGPYNLHCTEVYHALCISKFNHKAHQILSNAVSECLQSAAAKSHQSISFPAIGTGGLNFEREEVAQIMTTAVLEFAKNSSKKMEVYFVIYPSDHNTFKAFEDRMRSLQLETFNPPPTKAVTEQQDDGMGDSTAKLSVSGSSEESRQEAYAWLSDILIHRRVMREIQNNFITHFGEEEYLQLTKIICQNNVAIEEFLNQGVARLILNGDFIVNVAVACLAVENMLCKIQKDFVNEEAKLLSSYTNTNLQYERREIPNPRSHFLATDFRSAGLEIVKIKSVENPTLRMIFGLKKNQMKSFTTRRMLQRIPAHFCDMVSHIGFQAEFAPPDEPAQGQGIYFTGKVSTAMNIWSQAVSEYIYFVEADVLTGKSAPGKPDLILPPPVDVDPLVRYDSLSGGGDISVIFTGYQALPLHIITCKKT
ncbi:protein mono-ADP-ribosyltransferase PARP9 isoform X1 [Takifugu rubripes]|uniref:protein mono-ADP-ribosyltransferase PARP9 isoform X1 n=1 Tax=Takifugu rubripes TaxID=31033 RepID=UPI0011455A0A|nr:protein mono-ADP-ribosyltransferase PARP9 isoform X1 [Takifugu rubripes]